MKKSLIFILLPFAFACSSTQESDPHAGHDHSAGDGHDHGTETQESTAAEGEIVFTPTQASLGEFEVYTISPQPFYSVINTAGSKVSSPAEQFIVVAPVSGVVEFSHGLAKGQKVSKGADLIQISGRNLADGDTYSKVTADYNYAKSQWDRVQDLIKDRIISQQEYDQTKRDFQTAELAFNALKGTSRGVAAKVPVSGYVKEIMASNGAYVEKGAPLFSIVNQNRARLSVDVPQKYFSQLSSVASATFSAGQEVYDTALLDGKIISYSKSLDQNDKLLNLTIEYNGVDNLPEGAFVEVALRADAKQDAIIIPISALTKEQAYYFVYKQLDEECYQKVSVTIGHSDKVNVEILSGLKSGDVVVSKGAYRVKMAGASGAIPHGHEH